MPRLLLSAFLFASISLQFFYLPLLAELEEVAEYNDSEKEKENELGERELLLPNFLLNASEEHKEGNLRVLHNPKETSSGFEEEMVNPPD